LVGFCGCTKVVTEDAGVEEGARVPGDEEVRVDCFLDEGWVVGNEVENSVWK